MLIFSDLHLRDESAELVLGTVLPGILQAAIDRGEKLIACLGDVLHFRYRVPAPLLNGLRDWCLAVRSEGIELIFLPGNHDQYDVSGRNALEPLDSIEGVSVHTNPFVDKHGLWLPYRKRPEDIERFLVEPSGLGPNVCFLHHGIKGAWMNDNIQDSEGLPIGMFNGFRRILCGHYHKRQNVGRTLSYIGSPYQTKADEAGHEKGYAIWDGQSLEYVTTQWGKRYHRIKLLAGDQLDLSQVSPGDDVRVTTAAGVDPRVVGQQLHQAGIETHTVTPEVVAAEQRLDVGEGASLAQYAQAYVDLQTLGALPGAPVLDSKRLMETFAEVTA